MKAKIINIHNSNDYNSSLQTEISQYLLDSKIVIFPSDTIYGISSLMSLEDKVREIKKRDEKPFLQLISSRDHLGQLGIQELKYQPYFQKYWPGPVTFIVNNDKNQSIGVRMPDWDFLSGVIQKVNQPLISTSVNFSGEPALTDCDSIIENFGSLVDLIIADPAIHSQSSSTIADLRGENVKIIRQGDVIVQ